MEIRAGSFLISEPFLGDPHFHRSVVIITEHNETGSIGFVLNQPSVLTLTDIFEDEFPGDDLVNYGGPVSQNTFHYLHDIESLPEAVEILPGLYWSGHFDTLKFMKNEKLFSKTHRISFFIGYSGWGPGQLESEIESKSWILCDGKSEYIFDNRPELWKKRLKQLGGKYEWLSNAPDDVSLN